MKNEDQFNNLQLIESEIKDLRKNQTLLDFFNRINAGIIIYYNRVIEYSNPFINLLLSNENEQSLVGKSILDIVADEYKDIANNRINRLEMGEVVETIEETLLNIDTNEKIEVILSASPIILYNRRRIIVVIYDIRDRKKAEKALKESEAKYRTLIDNASDGIVSIINKRIVYVNKRFEKMTQYNQEEIKDKGFHILFNTEELIKVTEYFKISTESSIFETEIIKKDKTSFPVEWNLAEYYIGTERTLLVFIRDITQRKSNEMQMRLLSQTVEHSPNAITITDVNGLIIYVNRKFTELTGYSPEEVINKNPRILKSGLTDNIVYKELWDSIRNGKEWEGDIQNRTKQGNIYWERMKVSSIKDLNGNILYYIAFKENIDEKKKHEVQMLYKNLNLKMLSECYLALLNADEENELGFSFCEIAVNTLGFKLAVHIKVNDEVGINIISTYLKENKESIKKFENFIIRNLNCSIIEAQKSDNIQVCKKNTICAGCSLSHEMNIFESLIVVPIKVFSINTIILLYSDSIYEFNTENVKLLKEFSNYFSLGYELLSEKKERIRIESINSIEKEKLRIILSSIGDGVITINQQAQITFINTSALSILNLTYDIIGKNYFESIYFYNEIDDKINYNPFDFIDINNNENVTTKYFFYDENNKRRVLKIASFKIIDENNNFAGIVISIKDITKIEKIESQIALSQKMESVGQLAAGIAHEINTPMQFVGDNTHFLKDAFDSFIKYIKVIEDLGIEFCQDNNYRESITKNREFHDIEYLLNEVPLALDRTLVGIDRVRKIVLSMKSFAHSSGKSKTLSNINQGIEVTTVISKNEWKYVAELTTDLEENLPLVYCYLDQLNQVFLNMIVNSAHGIYELQKRNSEHQGFIKISTRTANNEVIISIEDNGVGINPEIIDRIFDPFFTTKEVGKGTGQGLAIVHDIIVNKHGGRVDVESIVNQGTKFIISLPIGENK